MRKYKAYMAAAALAFLMTIIIAPEIHEGQEMEPLIAQGDVILLLKQTYSENRGMPEIGEVVVLKKYGLGEQHEEDNPIRRVTGLPGDRYLLDDGTEEVIKDNYVYISPEFQKESESPLSGGNLIKSREIRGKAFLRLWPLDKLGGIDS